MILIDTSVWVDHFRYTDKDLVTLLDQGQALCHPFVLGEIALGGAAPDKDPLVSLSALPQLPVADPAHVMAFIARHSLSGSGVGYVDAHLLAAVQTAGSGTRLWSRDRRLRRAARRLDLLAVID